MEDIKWGELPFGYFKTDYNVRCYFKNGKWGQIEVTDSEEVSFHIAATTLHYGQEAFEGLKAFRGVDGKIRLFRWQENNKRMNSSAEYLQMPQIPEDLFREAMLTAVKKNLKYVPPYGTGASLYIRPLLVGSGPQVGVKPADEYLFMIFVTPVGPYFKTGFKPVDFLLTEEFDRAAPLGTGHIKAGGNYAAGMIAMKKAHNLGYANVLFLDSKEKKYIDEAGPANFFGIKDNTYITPNSPTILPSITNKSLCVLAEDLGLNVERRHIAKEELSTFEEAGACGTAAVISPIGKIVDDKTGEQFVFTKDGSPGPISTKLYNKLTGIQLGKEPDEHVWTEIID